LATTIGKACIRHVSYCRKKALNPPKPRKKACISCTKAKAHCDTGTPACSRCLDRNALCRYQNPQQPRRQTLLPASPPGSFLNQFTNEPALQLYSYPDGFAFEGSTLQTELPEIDIPYLDEGLNDLLSIYQPAPPVIKSFWPRKTLLRDLSLNRKYVLVNLSSYPRMMLSGNKDSAPPFVHSQYLIKNLPDRKFASDSLARCAGVVTMWSVKNKDNSVHIWRAIRSEQERIFEEVCLPQSMRYEYY
jgi:Fungal Zn(2)-Cys(6) binuclear cluster domain